MDKEVLNTMILILQNLYEDYLKKVDSLNEEKIVIENQINELHNESFDRKKFNFMDKTIFKRKKYKEYISDFLENNKKVSKTREELMARENIIYNEINQVKRNVSGLKYLIENSSSINLDSLSSYFGNYQEIEAYCDSKTIKMTYKDKLYFGVEKDAELMEKAILEDLRLIVFDNSYSLDLYKKVIDRLNEIAKSFDERYCMYNLSLYNELVSGKYDDHFVKHVMDYIKFIFLKGDTDKHLENYINLYYFGLTSKLEYLYKRYKTENFGSVLEKLYENEDTVIGCHGTSYTPTGDIIEDDKIFEDGIKAPDRGNPYEMLFTVAYNIPFLEVLNYDQNRYGNVAGGYAYIVAIPKSAIAGKEPLWGIGEDGKAYIMPKFICGKYKQFDENAEVIRNTNSKKKEYEKQVDDRSRL